MVDHLNPVQLWSVAGVVNTASAWRWTAVLAAMVTLASLSVLRWSWTPLLLAGSLVTLIPLGLTGHSSAGGSHDLATNSLLIHLVAASLWAGGLLALLAHALRGGDHIGLAARRFSAVALWCWVAMALSGMVNAVGARPAVRPVDHRLRAAGGRQVRRAVRAGGPRLAPAALRSRRGCKQSPSPCPGRATCLIRLALIEAAVFGLTFGVAVGLGRTAPPPPPSPAALDSRSRDRLRLRRAAHVARILFDWRFDLIFGTAAIVFAALYVAGVLRLRRRGDSWPPGRTVAWLLGCLALLFVTSSGVGRYMPAMFSMHMVAHMGLSMLVPILLVLGAPVSLALRALPAAGRNDPPGMREWLLAALHSRLSRFLTNPVVATVLFVAGFLRAVLLEPLRHRGEQSRRACGDERALPAQRLPLLLDRHRGGPHAAADPAAGQGGRGVRVVAAARVLRGGADGHPKVLGADYYRSLGLSWHTDLLGDQRLGGGIAWAAGEVPLVIVMLALLVQWARSDERTARRLDRAAERDDDAELAAYNAMLAELARRETPGRSHQPAD